MVDTFFAFIQFNRRISAQRLLIRYQFIQFSELSAAMNKIRNQIDFKSGLI